MGIDAGPPTVRPMRHDDLDRVIEIDRAVGWPHARDRFQYLLEDEETLALVADAGGVVRGFAFAGVREPAGWLGAVATDPAHRRHGIGGALCAAADAWLRADPRCDAAILEALPENAPAIGIYARLGFVATSAAPLCGLPREELPPAPPPFTLPEGHEVVPLGAGDWQTLFALDDAYWGGWREQDLLYWLSEGAELARLLRIDGQPRGYCLGERATGRIGPLAAPSLAGFLALIDDVLRSDALRGGTSPFVSLRPVDPDAETLAALAARGLHPVPALRHVGMEKVYRRPLRRQRGLYVSARPEKG